MEPESNQNQIEEKIEREFQPSFFDRYQVFLKGALITFLVLLLMIPSALILELIRERQQRQSEAETEVSDKWASTQFVCGPVITIPYQDTTAKTNEIRYIHFLPDELKVNGNLMPVKLHRSIFDVVVYNSTIRIDAVFNDLDFSALKINKNHIILGNAKLEIGISDLRGINDKIIFSANDQTFEFNSGLVNSEVMESGISAPIKLSNDGKNNFRFSFDLKLKGSRRISFSPIGKETEVNLNGAWGSPSFDGNFLPDTRTIEKDSFAAIWKVQHLNRNFPQSFIGENENIRSTQFGVSLKIPVDNYAQSERSSKYAILLIALTFLIFFFIENINKKPIHTFQYILVGFALVIFYTLLISFSEQIVFSKAYLIASIMTILLISFYVKSILKDFRLSLFIFSALSLLYSFIYVIIQMEDLALLAGSIGLFIVLAIVMYFSRKIDWNNISRSK